MDNLVCTVKYLDALTIIVNTREPSENSINVKLPNSSTIASTRQSQITLHNLSRQAKYAEIFTTLQSGLISIVQLCDDECIVNFDKHIVIVRNQGKYY